MDRRQKKTRNAIFKAFSTLLVKKRYESITVQDIIDEADIGRSTFYVHFETKDELLKAMCTDIFDHVFSKELPKELEGGHARGRKNLELKLGHILYHLKEHHEDLRGILSSESGELFMRFFRGYLKDLFLRYQDDFSMAIPKDFLLNHLVVSFAETVKWWIIQREHYVPEEVAKCYMAMISSCLVPSESI